MFTATDINKTELLLGPAVQLNQISRESVAEMLKTLKEALSQKAEKREAVKEEELLTRKEVMEFFGIANITIYTWEKRGWLNPLGKGRKKLYRKSELLERQG